MHACQNRLADRKIIEQHFFFLINEIGSQPRTIMTIENRSGKSKSKRKKTTCDRQVTVVDLTKGKIERTMKIGFNKQTNNRRREKGMN